MEITPGLHLIPGLEKSGVNAYIWERPDGGLTLIDAGMPGAESAILDYLDKLGRERLDRIILTHGDVDHIGGAAGVQAATGATVIAHAVEKRLIEGREPRRMAPSLLARLVQPISRLLLKRMLRGKNLTVDELVLDKTRLPEGFQVIHTPGHSAGHIALYHEKQGILIAGDALANRNQTLSRPVRLFTPAMDIAEGSIRKLAQLKDLRVACFGHGPPITDNPAGRLQAFADSL